MKKTIFSFAFLFSFIGVVSAQVAMGHWRTHFAYNSVSQIAQSENKIFAVSDGALYSIDKLDNNLEFYSKVSGLNGANISRIEYDKIGKQLIIIYANGNIDLLSESGVSNIPDFFNKQMSASKEVNHISFNGNYAYLSCDFGIIALNMTKKEVADTYIIGPDATEVKILNTSIYNDSIYALAENNIYKSSVNDPNLVNYEFWNTLSGLPGDGLLQSLVTFEGKQVLMRSGKLYIKDSNSPWQTYMSNLTFTGINVSNNKLNLFAGSNLYLVDSQFNVRELTDFATITDADYDAANSTYWFAGNEKGVISYNVVDLENPAINFFKPAGPAVNIPWFMTFAGERLYVVPGGRWASQYVRSGAVMIYENGTWTNILEDIIFNTTEHRALDFMNVAVDPTDNKHFFVTSYGTGLYEFKDDQLINWYTHLNSTIETAVSGDPFNYLRTDGAIFDRTGNLWFNNIGKFRILMSDGEWNDLFYTSLEKPTLGKILILNENPNIKWTLSVRFTPGICIFDDNGTISEQSDDKTVFLSNFADVDIEGGVISPSAFYDIVEDKNGTIWVGTDQGPLLFNNTANVFETGYTCSRVKIPRNDSTDLADYLLQNEKIKAIAIDGANRKWIGTESSGVYLMSENGQETIKHFTVSNSPLLSNDILSIAINPKTGEVFFGTGQGIVSYQSDASIAEETFKNVHAYPNPVREGYNGVITITGLVEDTQIKITDLKGNLVCETVSNGSLTTWDGKDFHGRKVNTGIYLVICASPDGTQSTITKILVIN